MGRSSYHANIISSNFYTNHPRRCAGRPHVPKIWTFVSSSLKKPRLKAHGFEDWQTSQKQKKRFYHSSPAISVWSPFTENPIMVDLVTMTSRPRYFGRTCVTSKTVARERAKSHRIKASSRREPKLTASFERRTRLESRQV